MARRKAGNGGEGDTTVGITRVCRDALQAYLATKHSPVMRDVITSLVLRFLGLPEPLRTAILNNVDEGMELAYADALKAMAQELVDRYKARVKVKPTGSRKGKNGTARPAPDPSSSDPSPEPGATKRSP